MSVLTDVVDFLDNNVSSVTKGSNLFIGELPAKPVNCAAVTSGTGQPPIRVASGKDQIHRTLLFVRVRDKKYNDGNELAVEILNGLQEADISGYLDVQLNQTYPNNLGQDSDGNYRFQFSFTIIYINVT